MGLLDEPALAAGFSAATKTRRVQVPSDTDEFQGKSWAVGVQLTGRLESYAQVHHE